MKPWFDTEARVALLQAEAQKWIGTPFCPNSSSPGHKGGVSCQKLAGEVYRGAGFVIGAEIPDVAMSHARFNRTSLVVAFMSTRREFEAVPVEKGTSLAMCGAIAGDLLGFTIHKAVHHLGVCVSHGVFVHAIEGCRVHLAALGDPTWGTRLANIWRPIE